MTACTMVMMMVVVMASPDDALYPAARLPRPGREQQVVGPHRPRGEPTFVHATFSSTVWKLYGGAKYLVMWY